MDSGGCASSEPFALQVIDDSMEPEFKRGCIVLIDPSGVAQHGDYVLAVVENGYIFRQMVQEDKKYYLQPLNEAYHHEKRVIDIDTIKGVIVQQSGERGHRHERKRY